MGISAQTCPNGTRDQAQGLILRLRRHARGPRRHIHPSHGVEHHMHGIGFRRDSRLAPYLCGLLQRICSSQAEQPHLPRGYKSTKNYPTCLRFKKSLYGLAIAPNCGRKCCSRHSATMGLPRAKMTPASCSSPTWLPSPTWMIVALPLPQ